MQAYQNLKNKLKTWFLENAYTKKAVAVYNLIVFAESSFFPIPPDPFLGLFVLANRDKWLKMAWYTTFFSVAGGIFGYLIGYFFFDLIGQPIVNFYHLEHLMQSLSETFNQYNFWAILAAAITPIPYKIFTISAGLFSVDFWQFIIASILGRGIRFFAVAYLFKKVGQKYAEKIFDRLDLIALILVVLIVLYFVFF